MAIAPHTSKNDLSEDSVDLHAVADDALELARTWVAASTGSPPDAAAERLAGILRDPLGLDFTLGFIDGVVRPEDTRVAARQMRRLGGMIPAFLSWPLRAGMRIAAVFAPLLPWIVVPIARWVLRMLVRHLIVDARPGPLGRAIAALTAGGDVRLNINLLGEAVLGDAEAARRVAGTRTLIERADVDYVSIKVSSTVAPHNPWAHDAAVAEAVATLRPLYLVALDSPGGPTFINLDMEEYRDLALTVEVFTTLLDDPALAEAHAGIVLQCYLPDAYAQMVRLQEWAAARVATGGAPIKVRVVKGANLPMERVDADIHDWPLATWPTKELTDANYKAVLAYALHPDRVAHVRVGVAGQNLFDIALAWELAGARGVRDALDVEMLIGMAPQQMKTVAATVGQVLLYTPVVQPSEFDVAIAYLIRRLEEGAAQENFMSAVFDLADPELFEREHQRFQDSLALVPAEVPAPHRLAQRDVDQDCRDQDGAVPHSVVQHGTGSPTDLPAPGGFRNTPDTDPSVPAHQSWARRIREQMTTSELGIDTAERGWLPDRAALDGVMERAASAVEPWGTTPVTERARVLRAAARMLEARRAGLIEVAGAECGKTIDQSDPEVSEAIDFANYYADSAEALDAVDGATHASVGVTVVTPPWNFPVAIPAGGVLAALAAGSPVVLKPAEQAARCAAVVAEALWEAGVPCEALQYVRLDEAELGEALITHRHTAQVILTGAYDTAALFRGFDPALRLFAETSGKNAIIVTPSADLDLAAKDVVASAFGHAGQKCSAASLVVLVGSVGRSRRFLSQLRDAASSLTVGPAHDATSQMGPVIEPPTGPLQQALTTLEPGQSWLLEPRCLDGAALWTPGIRDQVQPGSEFHLTEYFGPVLGVMRARSLAEAIDIVNTVDYGLTSGLHSLDGGEITRWLDRIEAGNLYVNRSITGAIVRRQPFGGWKRSAVGPGAKAGGPHYVASLVCWNDAPSTLPILNHDALIAQIDDLGRVLDWSEQDRTWLRQAWASDHAEWVSRRAEVSDPTALEYETNAQRYVPTPVTVRAASVMDVATLRVVGAGVRAGGEVILSVGCAQADALRPWLQRHRVALHVEDDVAWAARAAALADHGGRVRLVGVDPQATIAAAHGSPALTVFADAPVRAGAVELHPFLREQAVSITAHRFGTQRQWPVPAVVGCLT